MNSLGIGKTQKRKFKAQENARRRKGARAAQCTESLTISFLSTGMGDEWNWERVGCAVCETIEIVRFIVRC